MVMVKVGFAVRRQRILASRYQSADENFGSSGGDDVAQEENSSSSSSVTALSVAQEENPVIYVRAHSAKCVDGYPVYDWFCLRNNNEMSRKPPICVCGAVEDLKPAFVRPNKYRPISSIAALGQFIYVFGGMDIDNNCNDCAEVSYIDTHNPHEGWNVCQKQMPKALSSSFPITLDNERVLLVGVSDDYQPFSQLYNSSTKEWTTLESNPMLGRSAFLNGTGVVVEKKKGKKKKSTTVFMHRSGAPYLYTYNLNRDSWGIRWESEFGDSYDSGALVDGIYYVIDISSDDASPVLHGYDISEDHAKCLPVEILLAKDKRKWMKKTNNKEWWPDEFCDEVELLAFGDNKLAVVWYDVCREDRKIRRLCFYCSVFEMMKEDTGDDDCEEKLVALPVSHVCYHVNGTDRFDRLVTVFPSNCGANTNHATN